MVPGILSSIEVHPEVHAVVDGEPERLGPLWICVMPESCQPLRKPPAILLLHGVAQLDGVRRVENVQAVVRLNPIVVVEVELIQGVVHQMPMDLPWV